MIVEIDSNDCIIGLGLGLLFNANHMITANPRRTAVRR